MTFQSMPCFYKFIFFLFDNFQIMNNLSNQQYCYHPCLKLLISLPTNGNNRQASCSVGEGWGYLWRGSGRGRSLEDYILNICGGGGLSFMLNTVGRVNLHFRWSRFWWLCHVWQIWGEGLLDLVLTWLQTVL